MRIRDPRQDARGNEKPGPQCPIAPGPQRCKIQRFWLGSANSLWIALLVFTGGTAAARCAAADADSLTLDEAWFASLARAESLMSAASRCGEVDSADGAAVVEQIRIGVHVLGSFVRSSVAADTVIAGPLATVRAPQPPLRKHGILGAAGVISAVTGLAHVLATMTGASPQTRSALAYVGGSAAAVRGVFNA